MTIDRGNNSPIKGFKVLGNNNWLSDAWNGVSKFFGNISNTISGVWNDWIGNTANRENIDYQKEYNAEVFNRADTQYQRTVADLRSAGLSAQLAAGSPSTVAGASAAPQRTVGNESAAIERLVGLVNAIKQTKSNVSLQSAQADKAVAEADKARADALYTHMQSDAYNEKVASEITLNRVYSSYYSSCTFLNQIDGQTRGQKNVLELWNLAKNNDYVDQLIKTAEAQEGSFKSQTSLNYANRDRANREAFLLSQEILTEFSRRNNLDAQTKQALANVAYTGIQSAIADYNLSVAQSRGNATTDSQVGSTVQDENWLQWKRSLVKSLYDGLIKVGTGVAIGAGVASGLPFVGFGGPGMARMLGDDTFRFDFRGKY